MKPWGEIAIPHQDVLEGSFQQAEFAADITAVQTGRAPREYQDAIAFFERTFITEGMGILLTQVAQRLAGRGGEPVIQLQTPFGGGKTHTELAVYHLAMRVCPLSDLAGVPTLIERAGLMDVPKARVAALDGTAHHPDSPGSAADAPSRLCGARWPGSSAARRPFVWSARPTPTPGKDVLRDLLELHAPVSS